jgi:hypothetical protein
MQLPILSHLKHYQLSFRKRGIIGHSSDRHPEGFPTKESVAGKRKLQSSYLRPASQLL